MASNEISEYYPAIKKVAWRFIRVFISAFLATGSIILANVGMEAVSSWQNFKELLIIPFILGGLIAGINALGKLLREMFGSENKDSVVDKLPF